MELLIDTTDQEWLSLALRDKSGMVASKKVKAHRQQSEKLWPNLEKLLSAQGVNPQKLKRIVVANGGGGFTAVRIGIAAANALAFAWGLKVVDTEGQFKRSGRQQIVKPRYSGEANIS